MRKKMLAYYAKERGGIQRERQAMDAKKGFSGRSRREQNGREPHRQGQEGGRQEDPPPGRSARRSFVGGVLTGAERHDQMAVIRGWSSRRR